MLTVRARIALIAALATTVAVAVTGFFVLTQLAASLEQEVDESLQREILNFELELVEYADMQTVAIPLDVETLFVVVDANGVVELANDQGVSGAELVRKLQLDGPPSLEVQFADVSLTTPTDTTDAESLRAAYYELFLVDQLPDETFYVVIARSNAAVDRTVKGVRDTLLVGFPLLVAFVAALAWWLTGRSLRPVDRMRREVDEISSSDLTSRVSEPSTTDEIGQLARTMNRMLGRLAQANQAQEQFVSDAAHELRTPLTSIAAQIDVDNAHPREADRALTAANVRGEVSRLQVMIDGLLASARNHERRVPAKLSLVDLDVVASASASRVAKPENLRLDLGGISAAVVRGDETALASVVDNLLANAYRHARTTVAVGVGADTDGAWLVVDDDGTGIAHADRERIFDRFVRLDEARSRDFGGSGLGLALARETAVRHGGTLHAEESPSGGARMVLRLPGA